MSWKRINLSTITNNLDNLRKPLNQSQRDKITIKGLYPYIGANNVQDYVDEYIFDEKILCVSEDGGSWGKMEVCAKIYTGKTWVNNHAHVLTATEHITLEFLMYFLNYEDLNPLINGATRGKLTKKSLGNIAVPLPPLPIQKAIAEKLDKADALRKKDKQLLKYYDELAQSFFINMFGDPVKNEKGWEKEILKNVCSKIGSGSTPRGGKESYLSEGISLIRSLNIHDQRFKYKDLAFIDDLQAHDLRNVIVEEDDVLFNITGASVCRSCLVPASVLPARVNQHVSILRAKKGVVHPIFLNSELVFESKKAKMLNLSKSAGATREAITKQQLERIEIIVPPFALQNKFADIIENIEQQKQKVTQQAQESENLFQALLKESFS